MYFIWWYIVLQALAVLGAPMAFVCFHRCADRGWAFAKLIGFMLPFYLVWLLAHAGLAYGTGLVLLSVVAMAVVSFLIARARYKELSAWLGSAWPRLLALEAVFLAAYLGFGIIRAYNPEIESRFQGYGSEKLMDIMLVNSVHLSATFPPNDAWCAGRTINYYWYGYYLCSAMCKLTGIPTHVGYNLSLVTAAALAALGAYALAWHLAARWWAGVCAAVSLIVLGNPHSFRLLVGWGIEKQTEARYLWDCSRVINPPGRTINEFPYWSFLWGDLHGHVTSLPFTVLVLACAACIWLAPGVPLMTWLLSLLIMAVAYGTAVACNNWDLPAYALVLVFSTVAFAPVRGTVADYVRWALSAVVQRVAVVALGLLAIAPFLLNFIAPQKSLNWNIHSKTPVDEFLSMFGYFAVVMAAYLTLCLWRTVARCRAWVWAPVLACAVGLIPVGWYLSGLHTVRDAQPPTFDPSKAFLISGLLLAAIVLVKAELIRLLYPHVVERADAPADEGPAALAAARFVGAITLVALCIILGTEYVAVSDFYGKDNERMNTLFKFHIQAWTLLSIAGGWIVAQVLGGGYATLRAWAQRAPLAASALGWALQIAAVVVGVVVALCFSGALVEFKDKAPATYHLVASLLVLVGVVAWFIVERVCRRGVDAVLVNAARGLFCVAWGAVILLCLTFTVVATGIKTNRQHRDVAGRVAPTFDGRIWLAKDHPDDLAMIQWLQANGKADDLAKNGAPWILEAIADESYGYFSRISSFTGFPAVLGWPNHEGIWRREEDAKARERRPDDPSLADRKREGRMIYSSLRLGEVCRLVEKYKIDYIIAGELERKEFGADVIAKKFLPHTPELFASGNSSIRGPFTRSCDELDKVEMEGVLERRVDKAPPISPRALPTRLTLTGGATPFNEPRGVAIGPDNSVYVVDSKNGRVVVFDAEGQQTRVIPDAGETNPRAKLTTEYSGPCDVAVASDGRVYVADTWGKPADRDGYGRIVVYDAQGLFAREWVGPSGMFGPRGIALAALGDVYVTDTGNKRVLVFDRDGGYKLTWGASGEGRGEFNEPVGIAVAGDRVYVCDTGNYRVQVFNLVGNWVAEFAPYGWGGHIPGVEPHIAVDDQGRVYLTDSSNGRLQVFGPAGDPIQKFYGGLVKPIGVDVRGASGVVVEMDARQAQVFTLE